MLNYCLVILTIVATLTVTRCEKINLETLNNYSEFLNFGVKKLKVGPKESRLENSIYKSKVDILGEVFKQNIDIFKKTTAKLDLVFLIDASSSVGESNFKSELKFVKKLLSDVTVDYNHTRVAVITFGSTATKNIDEIGDPKKENNKCVLLNRELGKIEYSGGGTYTLGAFELAKEVFTKSRNESHKVLFLITDGFSNGGDPIPLAQELKDNQITIFTIGIKNGNYKELYELASTPGEFYSYLLDGFQEFENLARRALHVDLKSGDYIPLGINSPCNGLCESGNCCDKNALCTCGTTTGHFSCVCQPGFYGSGLTNSCLPCPVGYYSNGPNLCLPCPNIHHTTSPPALSIDNCKCKTGFRPTEDNQCETLQCPVIDIPDHGYFVNKKDCGRVLNSACGIRCEVGYTLVGSSIRLCQDDSNWSGNDPTCQVKTCTKLQPPQFGSMVCSHSDLGITYNESEPNLPVDTVCTFECESGKTLIGSNQRTCLPLARWDGLRAACKQIKCSKLVPPKNGKIEPKSCTIGKQPYGQKCTIECDEGFQIEGPSEKTCIGTNGLWDSKFETTACADATPPVIQCHKNITLATLPGKGFATTFWTRPSVTDNLDPNVTVWSKPPIKDLANHKFHIGANKVTYFAQDSYQNRAKCTFYVTVKDDERPTIENCQNPPVFLIESGGKSDANVTWDEPNIFDNSNEVNISKTHQFGPFPLGTTTVVYTAVDKSGNLNNCSLNVTLEIAQCEALSGPIYGHSDCHSKNGGMDCVITCQEGYAVPLAQPFNDDPVNFMCQDQDALWFNPEGLTVPECSITELPKEVEQNGTITITSDDDSTTCDNKDLLNELENDIKITIKETSCEDDCLINTNTTCEMEGEEEKTNKINVKREANFDDPGQNVNAISNNKQKKRVNVRFQVRGKHVNQQQQIQNISFGDYGLAVVYQRPRIVCHLGFVPRKHRCVQCPKGTFHNTTSNKCKSCPFGTYNDNFAQIQCRPCPLHHTTKKLHSKKIEDCKEQCPPGTQARLKIVRASKRNPNITTARPTLKPYCKSCPLGFYQPEHGKLNCIECPLGYTTLSAGSTDLNQCVPTPNEICNRNPNICNTGQCVSTNFDNYYYCNCSDDYIGSQCERRTSQCDSSPCLNGGVCAANSTDGGFECECPKGFGGKLCQDVEEPCLLHCLNGGKCLQNDANDYFCICPPEYGGDICQIRLNYCQDNLCENNSTCINEITGFKCKCPKGFIGKRCNILPCDYMPCKGNHICTNLMINNATKSSYQCNCPEGYTGPTCDQRIDYCANTPCNNQGTCTSNANGYTCKCPRGYSGGNCDQRLRSDYVLKFQQFSTANYVTLEGFRDNLTEITACLWIMTTDNFNYGTLLSYATRQYDNAFTVTDYTGLVLYINNNYVVTDVLLNDGTWHHVCTSWENSNGTYNLYVDGRAIKTGHGLGPGTTVQGSGNMVIGQEQDVLGGKFSQSESFVGNMAYVDVWSRQLTEEEILRHMDDCQDKSRGDLYTWAEIRQHVRGNVSVVDKSGFCQQCMEPGALYNGIINIVDNVAYYECYKGFYLSDEAFKRGRRCTKAGTWEGLLEPYCKRIYCGYPGYVRNGYTIGSNFYYQDTVTYRCSEGYDLTNTIGNGTVTCTETGKWYPEIPKCSGLQCTAFAKPSNSNLTITAEHSYEDFNENKTHFDIGTLVEVRCDPHAKLVGKDTITCLENGTWDHPPPRCIVEQPNVTLDHDKSAGRNKTTLCAVDKVPQPPDNGFIVIETLYKAGNASSDRGFGGEVIVEYKCRIGYKLRGENFSTCITDGYWTQPNITCDPILCRKPSFKNMQQINELEGPYQFGNMLKFECIDGYTLFGDSTLRCQDNGKWSRMRGKCTQVSCRQPVVQQATITKGTSFLYNDELTLICPSGNQFTIKCNSRGIWIGDRDETC